MTWGLVVGGALAATGAVVGSQGAKSAAREQARGADAATAEERRQYDVTREDLAPARETGNQALAAISRGLGLPGYSAPGTTAPLSFEEWRAQNPAAAPPGVVQTIAGRVTGGRLANPNTQTDPRAGYDAYVAGFKPTQTNAIGDNAVTAGDFSRDFALSDFVKDPGYEFRRTEGQRALEGSAAARTGIQNGRTLRELERYGEDYASGEFSNAYNRFNADRTSRFNRLATVAGIGQTATNTGAALGQNTANNISENIIGRANAAAAGRVGQASAVNDGLTTLGNFYLQRRYGGSAPKTSPVIYNETGGGTWAG